MLCTDNLKLRFQGGNVTNGLVIEVRQDRDVVAIAGLQREQTYRTLLKRQGSDSKRECGCHADLSILWE